MTLIPGHPVLPTNLPIVLLPDCMGNPFPRNRHRSVATVEEELEERRQPVSAAHASTPQTTSRMIGWLLSKQVNWMVVEFDESFFFNYFFPPCICIHKTYTRRSARPLCGILKTVQTWTQILPVRHHPTLVLALTRVRGRHRLTASLTHVRKSKKRDTENWNS